MLESIILESSIIEVSELESHPDYLQVKFVISDFETNKNGVRLNRDTIEDWMSTLIGSPLLGKITKQLNKKDDFSSHEMKIISYKGDDGKKHKKAVFDTSAFGVFEDVAIEKIDNVECIVATARVWKRFENACKIIQERAETLKSSWEIATEKFTTVIENGLPVKIIDKGRFIGHCCLGSTIQPAYDRTAVLQVASEQDDELNIALMEDLDNLNISSDMQKTENKEVLANMDENKNIDIDVSNDDEKDKETSKCGDNTKKVKSEINQNDVDNEEDSAKEAKKSKRVCAEDTEASALTTNDLRRKLEKEYETSQKCWGWCKYLFPADNIAWFEDCNCKLETDVVEVKYTVDNDVITITECNPVSLTVSPREINQVIAQKDNAIIEMSTQIQGLNEKISALQPYKDKVEEIEKAEKEAKFEQDKKELSEYAVSSGYITQEEIETSEEIKGYVENLDRTAIKSLIADRVIASLNDANNSTENNVETSDVNTNPNIQVNLSADQSEQKESDLDFALSAVRLYIGR